MKEMSDQHVHAKEHEFEIGDSVLVKQVKLNKWSTPYNPKPYKIRD